MSIEGIPEGWLPVRFDYAVDGEAYVKGDGEVTVHVGARPTQAKRLIVRKIEKPKKYRPFANAAEFEPHKHKWVTRVDQSGRELSGKCAVIGFDDDGFSIGFDDDGFWLGGPYFSYRDAFNRWHSFADGTPFGVEVTE